jgi:hypothetical protein
MRSGDPAMFVMDGGPRVQLAFFSKGISFSTASMSRLAVGAPASPAGAGGEEGWTRAPTDRGGTPSFAFPIPLRAIRGQSAQVRPAKTGPAMKGHSGVDG